MGVNVKKTCPVCGDSFSYIEKRKYGNRVYYYVVHYYKTDRRKRVKKCYLGTLNHRCLQSLNYILDVLDYAELTELEDELKEIFNYVEKIYEKLKEILILKEKEIKEEEEEHAEFCFVIYGGIDTILFVLAKKIGKDRVDELLYESVRKLVEKAKDLNELKEFSKKADRLLESYGNIGGYCVSPPYSMKLEKILSELHEKMVYVTPGELMAPAILLNIEKFAIPENEDLVNQLVQVRKKLFES